MKKIIGCMLIAGLYCLPIGAMSDEDDFDVFESSRAIVSDLYRPARLLVEEFNKQFEGAVNSRESYEQRRTDLSCFRRMVKVMRNNFLNHSSYVIDPKNGQCKNEAISLVRLDELATLDDLINRINILESEYGNRAEPPAEQPIQLRAAQECINEILDSGERLESGRTFVLDIFEELLTEGCSDRYEQLEVLKPRTQRMLQTGDESVAWLIKCIEGELRYYSIVTSLKLNKCNPERVKLHLAELVELCKKVDQWISATRVDDELRNQFLTEYRYLQRLRLDIETMMNFSLYNCQGVPHGLAETRLQLFVRTFQSPSALLNRDRYDPRGFMATNVRLHQSNYS